MKSLFSFLSILIVSLCSVHQAYGYTAEKVGNDSLKTIRIHSSDIIEEYNPTELIRNIEYTHLELTDDNFIGKVDKVLRLGDQLFILDRTMSNAVFCFDIEGKYLFKVGSYGRETGEYREIEDIVIDRKTGEIGILSRYKILWHNVVDGVYNGNTTNFKKLSIERVSFLDATTLIGYANNSCDGKKNCFNYYRLNKQGEILSRHLPITKSEKNHSLVHDYPFSEGEIARGFTHLFNDTIYSIDKQGQLYKKFHIDFGDMALTDRSLLPRKENGLTKWMATSGEKGLVAGLEFYSETDSVIVFNFLKGTDLLTTYYSKSSGKTITADQLTAETIIGGFMVGVHENQFISSASGDFLMVVQGAFESAENKEEIKEIFPKDIYDYIMSLEGTANPTIVFLDIPGF